MNRLRWLIPGAAIALLAIALPARSQDGIDDSTMEAFGGTYLADCANKAGPRLTVFKSELVYIEGDRRTAGKNTMAAASYFGNDNPDASYRTTLVSEMADGSQLLFIVHADARGPYIVIDGDTKAMAGISPAMRKQKFRRCDADGAGEKQAGTPAKAAPAAPPSAAVDRASGEGVTASGMLLDRKFKAAYFKALGALTREEWLTALDGPSPETRKVKVAGAEYLLIACCKDHDCHDSNTVLLWSAPRRLVYGLVHRAGRNSLIGAPTPAIAKELQALWKTEWRSNE